MNFDYLLRVAKTSIEHGFNHEAPLPIDCNTLPESLNVLKDTFVSLRFKKDEFTLVDRGCIGSTLNPTNVVCSIANNAYFAAFKDDRFPKLNRNLLDRITIRIYILHTYRSWTINNVDKFSELLNENSTLHMIYEQYRGTLLNTMQIRYKTKNDFIIATKQKANIPENIPWTSISGIIFNTEVSKETNYKDIQCL